MCVCMHIYNILKDMQCIYEISKIKLRQKKKKANLQITSLKKIKKERKKEKYFKALNNFIMVLPVILQTTRVDVSDLMRSLIFQ